MTLVCSLAGLCSGCPDIGTPYADQLRRKALALREAAARAGLGDATWSTVEVESLGEGGFRERVDLVLAEDGRLGLYETGSREVVALGPCPQLAPPLRDWLETFAGDVPRGERGSIRLRVGPDGRRGTWLDLSNVGVKRLLDEKEWLARLLERAVVEVGQRRKRLMRKDERLGLGDPELAAWSETYCDGRPTPLFTAVGGFTQVGRAANRALAGALERLVPKEGRWLELGCGAGTLTLPLLARGLEVTALDTDPLSLEGLSRSARLAGLDARLTLERVSFQSATTRLKSLLETAEGIVADPPRSGLGALWIALQAIPESRRPRDIVYVSCSVESFVADAARLAALGYRVDSLRALDLFPQTPHLELIARLTR